MSEMTDDEFLDYCIAHSETERSIFHTDHVARLLRLEGQHSRALIWEAQDTILAIDLGELAKELKEKRANEQNPG